MGVVAQIRFTAKRSEWSQGRLDPTESLWTMTVPGSVGLQLRLCPSPGTPALALPLPTSCCLAVVVEAFHSGSRCGVCRRDFPYDRNAVQIKRAVQRNPWFVTQDSGKLLMDILEEGISPLEAPVQTYRLEKALIQLFDKLDRPQVPMLRDRGPRLSLQHQAAPLNAAADD